MIGPISARGREFQFMMKQGAPEESVPVDGAVETVLYKIKIDVKREHERLLSLPQQIAVTHS